MFSKYHYLDHSLNYAGRVFMGYVNGQEASFISILPQPGITPNLFRISRIVVLPDFQGLGLGNRMNEFVGELYNENGKEMSIVTTHPGLIKNYIKSDKWILKDLKNKPRKDGNFDKDEMDTRLKASFRYVNKHKKNKKRDIWD